MLEKTTKCIITKCVPLGFVLLLVLTQSCKKEIDNELPKIDILTPSENKLFFIPDAVTINVEVTDNKALEYVRLTVTNENYVSVAPAVVRYPDANTTTISQSIVVDDPQLASGDYYVVVTASDGGNEKSAYRKIRFYGLERRYMGAVFVDDATSNQVNVYLVDTLYNKQLISTQSDDFGASAISSRNQAYYLMGNVTGDMQSVALSSSGVDWALPAQSTPPASYFTGVATYDGKVYISSYDRKIQGVGKAGNGILSIETGSYIPYAIHRQGDALFSEQRNSSSGQKKLVQYYEASGGFKKEISLDIEVVEFCHRTGGGVLVFGNNGSQGVMKDYDAENNSFWEPHDLPNGKVLSACRVDENNFMIGHESGVLWYRYNANSLVIFKTGVQATGIQYNDVDNIIVVATGSELKYYSFPSGSLVQSIGHSNPIKGIEVFFNK